MRSSPVLRSLKSLSSQLNSLRKTIVSTASLLLLAGSAFAQVPNAPSDLSATAVSGPQIDLSWTDNSNDESYFFIYRATSASGPFYWYDIALGDTTNYSDVNLFETNTYYYAVTAYNEVTESDLSNVDSATLPNGAPAAPCCLDGGAYGRDVYLAWTDQSYNEDHFIISRSLSPNGPFSDVGTAAANTGAFVEYELWDNTTIYYRIRSTNSYGDSSPTYTIQVHTGGY